MNGRGARRPSGDVGGAAASVSVLPTGEDRESRPAVRTRRTRRQYTCRHASLEVDEVRERVVCLECEIEIGPMQALAILSRDFDHQARAVESLKQERERLERDVAELKREERNAKARKRRRERLE